MKSVVKDESFLPVGDFYGFSVFGEEFWRIGGGEEFFFACKLPETVTRAVPLGLAYGFERGVGFFKEDGFAEVLGDVCDGVFPEDVFFLVF